MQLEESHTSGSKGKQTIEKELALLLAMTSLHIPWALADAVGMIVPQRNRPLIGRRRIYRLPG